MATNQALTIAHTYFDAISQKDVDKIMSISRNDVVCTSPLGQTNGAQAFHGFQEGFAKMIKKLTLVGAYGDDQGAVIVYEAETYPVLSAIVAEHIIVRDGKIASTTVIYDGIPFAEYAKSAQPH